MRLLVTRAEKDSNALATLLTARGHEVLSAPLFSIRYSGDAVIPSREYQALLVTSANGVEALRRVLLKTGSQDSFLRPVLAVGDASGAAARDAGFHHVSNAEGDVTSLAALVRQKLSPRDGPLLHAAASIVAGDLKGDLEQAGFDVDRVTLYEAVAETQLPDPLAAALRDRKIDGALFYSPRSARIFADLVMAEGLQSCLDGVVAYCLSQAVASSLAALPFGTFRIASRPSQAELLALLP